MPSRDYRCRGSHRRVVSAKRCQVVGVQDDAEVDGVETIRMRHVPSLPNPEAR
jgi:hypothetical protein